MFWFFFKLLRSNNSFNLSKVQSIPNFQSSETNFWQFSKENWALFHAYAEVKCFVYLKNYSDQGDFTV